MLYEIKEVYNIKLITTDHQEIFNKIIPCYTNVSENEFNLFISDKNVSVEYTQWYPHSDTLITKKLYKDEYGNILAYKKSDYCVFPYEYNWYINQELFDIVQLDHKLIEDQYEYVKGGELLSDVTDVAICSFENSPITETVVEYDNQIVNLTTKYTKADYLRIPNRIKFDYKNARR